VLTRCHLVFSCCITSIVGRCSVVFEAQGSGGQEGASAKGTRMKARRAERPGGPTAGVGFLGRGSEPLPHQLGGLGQRSPRLWEHCKLPSGALAEIEFDAFLAENMAFGDYKMTDIFTAETCIYSCIYSTLASFA